MVLSFGLRMNSQKENSQYKLREEFSRRSGTGFAASRKFCFPVALVRIFLSSLIVALISAIEHCRCL